MYKQLLLLGLLLEQPMYGQQVRELIEEHHALLAPLLKKPTMYYQLDRLVAEGALVVRNETVDAPGRGLAADTIAPRERDIYYLTDAGRQRFFDLLREALLSFTPTLDSIDVSIFFLQYLPPHETTRLLEERHARIAAYRTQFVERLAQHNDQHQAAHAIVRDHTLALLDAELAWLERTLASLRT